jgi:hypothetical protein
MAQTMHCPGCGKDVQEGDNFCFFCGFPVKSLPKTKDKSLKCAQCGTILREGDKFCGVCGAPAFEQKSTPEKQEPAKKRYRHIAAIISGYGHMTLGVLMAAAGFLMILSRDNEIADFGYRVVSLATVWFAFGILVFGIYLWSRKHPGAKRHGKKIFFFSLALFLILVIFFLSR